MFDRSTEKARRVIFFARYEASQYGWPQIESEHLLLGFVHEERCCVGSGFRKPYQIRSGKKSTALPSAVR